MLTQKDLHLINELLKPQFEQLGKRIDNLPTKDEFYDKMDELVTELQKTRDEQVMVQGRIEDHENRIETLEAK